MNDDDIIWITRGGKHIPIKKGDTNEYMNNKIRRKGQKYTLYHSSTSDFNEFDDEYIGKNSLGGLAYGKGHYFLPLEAYVYGREQYKVEVELKKPFIVSEWDWSKALEEEGYNWYSADRLDPSDFLKSKGYDGTVIMQGNSNDISEVIIYTNEDKKIKIVKKSKRV